MSKFTYYVHEGWRDIEQSFEAKDRISADLLFSAKYPDTTPDKVIEKQTLKTPKAKKKSAPKK